jgi:hypothetical protein
MGYIKEPKGVDFNIKSEPLTDKERQEISKFIANYKAKNKKKKPVKRQTKKLV